MIEDSIYDVIIVEYDRRSPEYAMQLARRLRGRFPDATIIYTRMWNLMDVYMSKDGRPEGQLRQWISKSGFPKGTPEALDFVLKQGLEFSFDRRMPARIKALQEIADQNNIILYKWDLEGNAQELVTNHYSYFADLVHLNEEGHRYVANGIRNILEETKAERSNHVGTWGDGDHCASWIETGEVTNKFKTSGSNVIKFDSEKEKYALELDRIKTVAIENTFPKPRKLFITYMATHPDRIYPKIKMCSREDCVVVDPIAADHSYPVHVQETKYVGMVKPGRNMFVLKPLEETKENFRMVGFAITNDEFKPSSMFFKPELL